MLGNCAVSRAAGLSIGPQQRFDAAVGGVREIEPEGIQVVKSSLLGFVELLQAVIDRAFPP